MIFVPDIKESLSVGKRAGGGFSRSMIVGSAAVTTLMSCGLQNWVLVRCLAFWRRVAAGGGDW